MRNPSLTRLAHGGILAAAVSVFSRLGFTAARVEDILEAAHIARRTFYKYFDGKEDLLAAVYELATGELFAQMRAAASAKDPLDAIRRGIDVYLDYHVENAALLRVLVEQAIRADSPLYAARARFRADLVRTMDDAVRATSGERLDPLYFAALISALEGVSLELLRGDAAPRDVARAKRAMHLLLTRALRPDSE